MDSRHPSLPIDDVLPVLATALHTARRIILSAPPGAGKTTRVPLALLNAQELRGKRIVMLEPRRLAARRAAEYMSSLLGQPVGQTVGYRIRGQSVVGPSTRIVVVTEGILTRLLHSDAALQDTGLVIFDEFHERSIHADLGLALVLDVQDHLRDDLRLLVMSATLDGVAVTSVMPDATIVRSEGRAHPVQTHYAAFRSDKPIEDRVAEGVARVLRADEGDILVFLPGRREIQRVEERLYHARLGDDVVVHILHGEAPPAQQAAALEPAPRGMRKVILATNVAETSLTIDGVRIVVDSGLARMAQFDPSRGMSGLVTIPVSRSSADQRRGRAGRQGPGICYRLWTEQEHESLPAFPAPEIKTADLAPLALDLARWGDPNASTLRFIDPPPSAHLSQARSLLRDLGALDRSGALTVHGRAMSDIAVHPRLAHMLLKGTEMGLGSIACDVAALLEERDLFAGRKDADVDLTARLHTLEGSSRRDAGLIDRVRSQSARLRETLGIARTSSRRSDSAAGILLALAYPERVARQRERGSSRYHMVNGTTGILPSGSLLTRSVFLAVGDADGVSSEARIYLAASLSESDVRRLFGESITADEEVRWDAQSAALVVRGTQRLGNIVLKEITIAPSPEREIGALCEGIRSLGLTCLSWSKEARAFQERSEWLRLRQLAPGKWPEMSEQALLRDLEHWIGPALIGSRTRKDLSQVHVLPSLRSLLTHAQQSELECLAPTHLLLPSGSRIALDYSGVQPVLAVKLQELFGQTETPRIAGGREPVVLHLLSPASRPLAVTRDLRSFWETTYPEIRTQMRARYPKHVWPERPLDSAPMRGSRKKR